jgi:Asp-tRNA(Asn)/Glu-tRNA(Gln) amidotransferase A subunit family amidase
MARAAIQKHGEWVHHNNRREALRMAWRDFFEDWDILLCPQMATTAFEHDHRPMAERTLLVDGSAQPFFQQIFWAGLVTVAYLPSTVFPTGTSGEGLPIGLQAVGAEYADLTCIDFARLMRSAASSHLPGIDRSDVGEHCPEWISRVNRLHLPRLPIMQLLPGAPQAFKSPLRMLGASRSG